MDTRVPHRRAAIDAALARIPDEPRWVDVRGMLLSGRARVEASSDDIRGQDGFLVVAPDVSLAGVVGHASPGLIRSVVRSLRGDVNLLVQHEDAHVIAAAFPEWRRQIAILHVLPGRMPWEDDEDPGARVFTKANAPSLDHVPEDLRIELRDALQGRTTARYVPGEIPASTIVAATGPVPMAAVWSGPRPVAFCYPVWQTERWWDVSIDTLEPWRRQGLGARAARALIRHLRASGRAPVWGALDTNTASRALAARLGFIESAGVSVFTPA